MSEEDVDSLESVPTFEDALKLPLNEYYKYAKGMFEYRANCKSSLAETYDKFYEWCVAMNCLENLDNCRIPFHPQMSTVGSVTTPSMLPSEISNWPITTLSYVELINKVGHNGTCYDDYYCTQTYLATHLHYLLGIMGLLFCLGGILFNLLFLPAFNLVSNRTGSTLYLTAMVVFDCLFMTLFTLIVVIRHIPIDYIQQLEMYARFSSYLIPHGLPTMELLELLSVWITVALLVDRFLYLKFGFHSKLICSRKLSVKIIATVVFFLIIYTIPKYLEYKLIAYPKIGIVKVIYTTVGFSESFQNLLLHWLKVPVEMFLPYLAVAIFSILNSIKLYDLMFKRKLSEASKERKLKYEKEHFEEISLNRCEDDGNFEKAQKFPSLVVNSKIPIITNTLKSMEDKENAIVIVALILGFSLIALKIPKFVLHALKSEGYVESTSTKFFRPASDFLDLTWVAFKPLIFCVARHFRAAVVSVFCCRDFDSEIIIEVLPVTEIGEIAIDYMAKCHHSSEAEKKSNENCKLLEPDVEGRIDSDDGGIEFQTNKVLEIET